MSEEVYKATTGDDVTVEFHYGYWRDFTWEHPQGVLDALAQSAAAQVIERLTDRPFFDLETDDEGGPVVLRLVTMDGYLVFSAGFEELLQSIAKDDGWADDTIASMAQALRAAAAVLEAKLE